jgi:hypothetical protein
MQHANPARRCARAIADDRRRYGECVVHHIAGGIVVGGVSIAAIGLLVGAAMKPDLDDRTRAVEHDWTPVAAAVDQRADRLARLDAALEAAGAHSIAASGESARAEWSRDRHASTATQIAAANALESATARALALAASPAYAHDDAVVRSAVALRDAAPPSDAVDELDRAVARVNAVDNNAVRRLVAGVVGHDDMPAFIAAS